MKRLRDLRVDSTSHFGLLLSQRKEDLTKKMGFRDEHEDDNAQIAQTDRWENLEEHIKNTKVKIWVLGIGLPIFPLILHP